MQYVQFNRQLLFPIEMHKFLFKIHVDCDNRMNKEAEDDDDE